jgi:pimeloyl-ACP methyl ester carboxylesterase
VVTVDLRGHGKSDKPNIPYTVEMFAKDVTELIKALNLAPVHLVGHSLGGMIAFQLTLDSPELVKTLTIINSAPDVEYPSFKMQIGFMLRSLSVKLFGMEKISKMLANAVFPKPSQVMLRQTFVERWLENDPVAYLNSLKAFPGWSVKERLPSLICPTLIISGDRDYTPVSYKQAYMKFIPNAKLEVIADSGHISIIDQSEVCNQILLKFLKPDLHFL